MNPRCPSCSHGIEGLESLRHPVEKTLRPESRARYDIGKTLALLAPATPKAPEGTNP